MLSSLYLYFWQFHNIYNILWIHLSLHYCLVSLYLQFLSFTPIYDHYLTISLFKVNSSASHLNSILPNSSWSPSKTPYMLKILKFSKDRNKKSLIYLPSSQLFFLTQVSSMMILVSKWLCFVSLNYSSIHRKLVSTSNTLLKLLMQKWLIITKSQTQQMFLVPILISQQYYLSSPLKVSFLASVISYSLIFLPYRLVFKRNLS